MNAVQVFHASEGYAAGRMEQLPAMSGILGEIVHDALMAAYQAGALAVTENLSVEEALRRVAA